MGISGFFREPAPVRKRGEILCWAAGSLAAGILLGLFSMWLDAMSIDDGIWWQRIFGALDLRNIFSELPVWLLLGTVIAAFSGTAGQAAGNVFLFFAGMPVSYHGYTVWVCGFNPWRYMLIWYGITLLSPLAAVFCWCAGGRARAAGILQVVLYSVMLFFALHAGWLYLDVGRWIDLLFLALMAAALWQGPKKTGLRLAAAFMLRGAAGWLLGF